MSTFLDDPQNNVGLTGTDGGDQFLDSQGNDTLFGGAGDDLFRRAPVGWGGAAGGAPVFLWGARGKQGVHVDAVPARAELEILHRVAAARGGGAHSAGGPLVAPRCPGPEV